MVAGEGGLGPGPEQITDLEGFIEALNRLRGHAGSPSYRALAKRVGTLLRPPREVPFRTVADVFRTDRRRLDMDLVLAVVRALDVDEGLLPAWRSAYLRVQNQARTGGATGVFQQLPGDLPIFTGREEPLQRLLLAGSGSGSGSGSSSVGRSGDDDGATRDGADGATATTVVVSAIEGMAGIGKTKLAIHAAHRLVAAGRYADAQFYVNLRGFDPDRAPADPDAVLESFLRQLGVASQQIPQGVAERAAMFRDRTHALEALIVLDDAADENQVRELIPSGPGCLVLITSRRTLLGLDGATTLRLDKFSAAESLTLLRRIVGAERIDAEPEAAATLAEFCDGLPLAVSLAAARLRSRPAWTVAELCRRLRNGGLDAVRSGDASLSVLFDVSYDALPAAERRLFRLLSLHPGADFTAPAAAALAGVEDTEAAALLERLQDDHLLSERALGRYEMHDLLRAFAADRAARDEPADARDDALDRVLAWYLHSADAAARHVSPSRTHSIGEQLPPGRARLDFADRDEAQDWLDREYQNLLAAHGVATRTGRDEITSRLPRTLWEQFNRRAAWREWRQACEDGIEAARRLADATVLITLMLDLGGAHFQARRHMAAAQAYRQAADFAGERGAADAQATARLNLGLALTALGRFDEAVAEIEAAAEAHTASGNRYGRAAAISSLAGAAFHQGEHAAALEHQLAALAIWEEIGAAHHEAIATVNVGQALQRLGRIDEAADVLRRGVELNRGTGNGPVEASAWEYLGDVRTDQQDRAGAVEAYQTARSLVVGLDEARAEHLAELIAEAGRPPGGAPEDS